MSDNKTNNLTDTDFLTEKRFQRTYSETQIILEKLKQDNSTDLHLIEGIKQEDALLKIKFRTYKKSKRNTIISFITMIVCGSLGFNIPILHYVAIISFFVLISSFFGIQSNKIPIKQRDYFRET